MNLGSIPIRSGAAKARIAVSLLQAFALLAINAACADSSYGSLMFTSPRLNILAVLIMLLLPVLGNVLLWRAISRRDLSRLYRSGSPSGEPSP